MNNNQPIVGHDRQTLKSYQIAFMERPYQLFTYGSTEVLDKGMIVEVPFGRSIRVGCVWQAGSSWSGEMKNILRVVQNSFWAKHDIDLLLFCQSYYHAPLQEILQAAVPSILRKGGAKKKLLPTVEELLLSTTKQLSKIQQPMPLTEQQRTAVSTLVFGSFYRYYLYGITGSGKTRCYTHWIEHALQTGNVLLMIPEIHLSHQMISVLERDLDVPIIPYHSQLTPKKRRNVFLTATGAEKGVVFLTTRSGIFLPIRSLSLIIVDEEHDHSYKQTEGLFRYHARDLALKKAQLVSCPCVLGSATPSMKFLPCLSSDNPPEGWGRGFLTERATGYPLPQVEVVMAPLPTHQDPLAFSILKQIRDCLEAGQQVLIYLNQRGYAPKLFCPTCRKTATCEICLTSLTQHVEEEESFWVCHHCSKQYTPNSHCHDCQNPLVTLGFGTQRLAEYLQDIFSEVPVFILDTDHLKTPSQVQACFEKIKQQSEAILIGTQMISKGHDWPKLSLVVVLVAAYQLKDQITPTVAQQIMQTAGRAGRHQHGRVLLPIPYQESPDQTLTPLLSQNYLGFMHAWASSEKSDTAVKAKFLFNSKNLDQIMRPLRSFFLRHGVWGPCLDYPYRRGALWRVYGLLITTERKVRAQKSVAILNELQSIPLLKQSFLSIEIDPLDI